MAKIVGGTAVSSMPVPDWNQKNPNKADYIKNKPEVANALTGTVKGFVLSLLDVSPVEQTIEVRAKKVGALLSSGKVTKYTKNYIPYPHYKDVGEKVTSKGVTFVDNGDNTITANGKATGEGTAGFTVVKKYLATPIPKGNYIFYGFDKIISDYNDPFYSCIQLYDENNEVHINKECHKGTEVAKFTVEKPIHRIILYLRVKEGVKVENQKFYSLLFNEADRTDYSGILSSKIQPSYPETYLLPIEEGSEVSTSYNKDLTKAYENLVNAIISLGGNV